MRGDLPKREAGWTKEWDEKRRRRRKPRSGGAGAPSTDGAPSGDAQSSYV